MVSGHIARGVPLYGHIRFDVLHAALLGDVGVDVDLRRLHRAHLRRRQGEGRRGALAVGGGPVDRDGRDRHRVGQALCHLPDGYGVAVVARVLIQQRVRAVRDGDMIPGYIARGVPLYGRARLDVLHAVLLRDIGVDVDLRRLHRAHGGLGRALGRAFRRALGLRHAEREAQVGGPAVLQIAIDRHGCHAQRVDLARGHAAGAQRGAGAGEVLRDERLPHAVEHLDAIVADLSLGAPAQRERAVRDVVYAVHADADDRLDGHLRYADLAGRGGGRGRGFRGGRGRGGGRGGAAQRELQVRPARVVHGAVGGDGAHGDGVEPALLQRGGGEVAGGVGHLLGDQRVARVVLDAHIVGGDVAVGAPGEVDARDRGVDVVYAVHGRLDGGYADPRRAHLARGGRGGRRGRGLDVDGRAVGVEKLLRLHGGHAGHVQARGLLEQLHGRLRHRAEVSGDVGAVVVQLAQAALQPGHAVVGIAALERDIAAVFRRAGGEQPALQRGCGRAGLPQAQIGLQTLDGGHGGVVVGAAGRPLVVVQLLEALVELAHAVARVALFHVNVALAGARGGGVELCKRLAGGGAAGAQAGLLLEHRHRLLRAGAVDAVRAVGEVAQLAQAILQDGHAQAGIAARERLIGVVCGKVLVKEHVLKLGRGHAVDGKAAVGKVGLQKAHRVLRAGAVDAVRIVV